MKHPRVLHKAVKIKMPAQLSMTVLLSFTRIFEMHSFLHFFLIKTQTGKRHEVVEANYSLHSLLRIHMSGQSQGGHFTVNVQLGNEHIEKSH